MATRDSVETLIDEPSSLLPYFNMVQFPEEPLDLSPAQGFGYFPAYPGLVLKNDRYKVLRKLGFGPRSSVWLAADTQDGTGYSALKILTVHASTQSARELRTLKAIKQAQHHDLPNLKDHFIEQSHHGSHQCLSLSLLGPDVEALRVSAPTKSLPVHIVQKIVASILEPLDALHRTGIMHGAVKADNFLFFVGQREQDLRPVLETLPPSVVEQVISIDGVEYPLVRSQPIPHGFKWDDKADIFADCSVYLSNVGHSQFVRENPAWEKDSADISIRPPEVILGTKLGTESDIWMLGCATYELLTGKPLFSSDVAHNDSDHLARMMGLADDRIDETMALSSNRRSEFFDEEGIFVPDILETTLSDELKRSGKLTDQEIPDAVSFIEACLTLDPRERPTVNDLAGHNWTRSGFACSCGFC